MNQPTLSGASVEQNLDASDKPTTEPTPPSVPLLPEEDVTVIPPNEVT